MAALLVASIFAGIIPMVIWATFLWWFDRYEKEPLPLVLGAFLWGCIPAVIFAVIAQAILDIPTAVVLADDDLAHDFVLAGLYAPVTEELVKGFGVMMIFLLFRHEIDSPLDGIIYGGLIGFGFAAVENVMYFMGAGSSGEFLVLVTLRAFVFGLNHAFFTSLTGIGFALARFRGGALAVVLPALGLICAMVAHSLHNIGATVATVNPLGLLFSLVTGYLGILLVFVVIVCSLTHERRVVKDGLADEVTLGTLTREQVERASSLRGRLRADLVAFLSFDFQRWMKSIRFHHDCAELAFKKHQAARLGADRLAGARVIELRQSVAALARMV